MPECTVCGSEEFQSKAGLLFCAVCQTQSQDVSQAVEQDDNYTYNVAIGEVLMHFMSSIFFEFSNVFTFFDWLIALSLCSASLTSKRYSLLI